MSKHYPGSRLNPIVIDDDSSQSQSLNHFTEGSRLNPIILDDMPSQSFDRRLNHPFRLGSRINPIVIDDNEIDPDDWLNQLYEFTRIRESSVDTLYSDASSVDTNISVEEYPVSRDTSPVLEVRRNSPIRREPPVMNQFTALSTEPPAPVLYEQPAPYNVVWALVTFTTRVASRYGLCFHETSYLVCLPEP